MQMDRLEYILADRQTDTQNETIKLCHYCVAGIKMAKLFANSEDLDQQPHSDYIRSGSSLTAN